MTSLPRPKSILMTSLTHPEQDKESEDEASDCGVTADQETVEL